MVTEKVQNVIDIINDMDIKDKLRLAIRVNSSMYTNILYDKKEMFEYFDNRLKEVDEEYRTTIIDFSKYLVVNFTMATMMEMSNEEQNQVVLYLFNILGFKQEHFFVENW